MKPTVASCITGGYDRPKPIAKQSVDCDFVMFTDFHHPSWQGMGWDFQPIIKPLAGQERLLAKVPKMSPWSLVVGDGPWIWVDGHMEIISPTFVEEALDAVESLGQWTHPDRDCIYTEAWFSQSLPKYRGMPLVKQADSYRFDGHPEHWGLWAAGLIVYKEPQVELGNLWVNECHRWSVQDQISEPPTLRILGLRPESLPYSLRDNPWIRIHPHKDGTS